MKTLLLFGLLLAAVGAWAQSATYHDLPVVRAHTPRADYRLGQEWTRGKWRVRPGRRPDVLPLALRAPSETLLFRTDQDSLRLTLRAGDVQRFYVQLATGRYALTEVRATASDTTPLVFALAPPDTTYPFRYETGRDNPYLAQLRQQYQLDTVVQGARTDAERALRLLHWVHGQWKHSGSHTPSRPDALTILAEARRGKRFRCVEYGIVAAACLNAYGVPARVLGLKTKEVETTLLGAGHVLLEAWLPDQQKWALLDGQWDVMPVLRGRALNAVELQQAIATDYPALEIWGRSGVSKKQYTQWVYRYLYYLDVKFDNREGPDLARTQFGGKIKLMLVPVGAKEPAVFQRKTPINSCIYTRSLAAFYARPE